VPAGRDSHNTSQNDPRLTESDLTHTHCLDFSHARFFASRFTSCLVRHANHEEHDAGDFFSDAYLEAWMRICRSRPDTNFYAYSKEIERFRRLIEPNPPPNFLWVFSYGGTQDAALNPAADRVADVFPNEAAIAAAGWASQEASDLLAVLGPRLVGVPANRIPTYLKRLAGRRFSEWQAEVDAERAARRGRRHLRLAVDNTCPTGQRPSATTSQRPGADTPRPMAA
jgi:hypothetical protein